MNTQPVVRSSPFHTHTHYQPQTPVCSPLLPGPATTCTLQT